MQHEIRNVYNVCFENLQQLNIDQTTKSGAPTMRLELTPELNYAGTQPESMRKVNQLVMIKSK